MTAAPRDFGTPDGPDPAFPPEVYARTAQLLRLGVMVFFLLAFIGLVGYLVQNPSETLSSLVNAAPGTELSSVGAFVSAIVALRPVAFIVLGLYVIVGVTIARVLLAMTAFLRAGDRTLAGISALVVFLLLLGFVVVGPLVR